MPLESSNSKELPTRNSVENRWAHAARKRNCYCGLWGTNPASLEKQELNEGYCGFCVRCGEPGHTRHAPGGRPLTAAWCDKCYRRAALLSPGTWWPLLPLAMLISLALPIYNGHVERRNLETLVPFLRNVRLAMDKACSSGNFASKDTLGDAGVLAAVPSALVLAAHLKPFDQSKLRLTLDLANFGPAWSPTNEYERSLVINYECTAGKTLAVHLSPKSSLKISGYSAALRKQLNE